MGSLYIHITFDQSRANSRPSKQHFATNLPDVGLQKQYCVKVKRKAIPETGHGGL
jgi:hypothetical protein